jgi:hypothetical protein
MRGKQVQAKAELRHECGDLWRVQGFRKDPGRTQGPRGCTQSKQGLWKCQRSSREVRKGAGDVVRLGEAKESEQMLWRKPKGSKKDRRGALRVQGGQEGIGRSGKRVPRGSQGKKWHRL